MVQFIMEAIVLCEVGGVIGVVAGIIGGNLLALLMQLPPVIPLRLGRAWAGTLLRGRHHLRHLPRVEGSQFGPLG